MLDGLRWWFGGKPKPAPVVTVSGLRPLTPAEFTDLACALADLPDEAFPLLRRSGWLSTALMPGIVELRRRIEAAEPDPYVWRDPWE